MKCPNCGSSVTLSPHPKTPGVTRFDCNGDVPGVRPCKQWGTIVPDGLAPPENIQAEQRKDAAYLSQQKKAVNKAAPKKSKKKKSAKARR